MLKPELVDLYINAVGLYAAAYDEVKAPLENAQLFGLPLGCYGCETPLEALIKYGVDKEKWERGQVLLEGLMKGQTHNESPI